MEDQIGKKPFLWPALKSIFDRNLSIVLTRLYPLEDLKKTHILSIARQQIHELLQRDGFIRRTTMLNISDEALEWVARRGYDPTMGGRALKRQIERDLTTLSADQLIATRNDTPILFDIVLKDEQLYPKITTFEVTPPLKDKQWMPALPEEGKEKRFLGKLINTLKKEQLRIDTELRKKQDAQPESNNWLFYNLIDRLREARENLETLQLGFTDRKFTTRPVKPLRLKRIHSSSTVGRTPGFDKHIRSQMKDFIFQKEGMADLHDAYHGSIPEFTSAQSELLQSWLSVSYASMMVNHASVQEESTNVQFRIWPCVSNQENGFAQKFI